MSFADTLIQTALSRPLEKNKFMTSIQSGAYPRPALKIFGLRYMQIIHDFPRFLARIISICPDLQIRAHLMGYLLFEEGMSFSPQTGKLEILPERNQFHMIKNFGRPLGIDEDSLSTLESDKTFAWAEEALAKGQWLGPAAFKMVGVTANMRENFRILVPALKKNYGFTNDDLCFFSQYIAEDKVHVRDGANLLEKAAQTPEQKQMALDGVKRGAQARWLFYEMCHRDMRRQTAASPSQ